MPAAIFMFLVALAGVPWSGFVTSTLWGWFIVPLGISAIGLWHAAGISFLLSSFLGIRGFDLKTPDNRSAGEKCFSQIFLVAVLPAAALLFGWLAKLAMDA